MPATPTMALPYPAAADPANVPLDMQELAERIETVRGGANGLASLDSGGKVPAAQLPASGPAMKFGTVRGTDAVILAGSGFTVVRNSIGKYTVTFSPAMTTLVSLVGAVVGQVAGSSTIFCATTRSATGFVIELRDNSTSSGALRDYDWSFLALGT